MKLAEFAKEIIAAAWDGCGVDAGEIQELAVEYGLITETKYDQNKHSPTEFYIAPGEKHFELSEEFTRAMEGKDNG